jgi:hypothetical protein
MPFIDSSASASVLESVGAGGPEAMRKATYVGKGQARGRLIAVAILANMAKGGRTLAVVTRPYAYVHPIYGADVKVEVPQGFVTDFASIPAPLQLIVQPFGRHAPAAVLHDYLYAIGQKKARALADRLFLNAMKDAGVPAFRRSLMFRMVRLFGICWAPEKPKRQKAAARAKTSSVGGAA